MKKLSIAMLSMLLAGSMLLTGCGNSNAQTTDEGNTDAAATETEGNTDSGTLILSLIHISEPTRP